MTISIETAKRRAHKEAPKMIDVLAKIAASPEPPKGSQIRVRAAGLVLAAAGLVTTAVAAASPMTASDAGNDE